MPPNVLASLPPSGAKPRTSKKTADTTVASLVEYVEEQLRKGDLEAAITANNHLLKQVAADEEEEKVNQSVERSGKMIAKSVDISLPDSWKVARQQILDLLSRDTSQNTEHVRTFPFGGFFP
jgi:hypothetical protein